MNWIRREKRLAIYLRDGLACCWCGDGVEDGVTLTLDHLKPHSKGGSNEPKNLVTCCHKCNSSRSSRSVQAFALAVAGYSNAKATDIVEHITKTVRQEIDVHEAMDMIYRRGGFSAALKQAA